MRERGQLWMISPYRVLRLVHAVRLPLTDPTFATPQVTRDPGSVQASIVDPHYVLDAKSTADIDAEAFWTDPLDDPSDPTNDPRTATVESQGHAFKASIPDPGPLTAQTRPMEVFSPPSANPLTTFPGVVHNIGDTLHHLVDYTATASSRFAEFFTVTKDVTFSGVTPLEVDPLGIDPASVVLLVGMTELAASTDGGATGDYVLDSEHGTITLTSASNAGVSLSLTYIPIHQVSGIPFPIHILSSAAPKAPKVVRVTPAWTNNGPDGDPSSGITYSRIGGYIRVYLERPWYSTGAGELLGVVGLDQSKLDGLSRLPSGVSPSQVTLMGLDPISVSSLDQAYPIVPSDFGATATVPPVPFRSAYASPPELPVSPGGTQMQIWPYAVQFDPVSNNWYADVNIGVGSAIDGPPPGYFVRLALVRFQPYSIDGAEISSVVLATFAQPVPDRFVSVTEVASSALRTQVTVEVSGTGYYGWRPPDPKSAGTQIDNDNLYAPHPFSPNSGGRQASSSMVVEVQVQDTTHGLSGELSWVQAPGFPPVMLSSQSFSGSNEVSWALHTTSGRLDAPINLPFAIGSPNRMRLRISELDYYPFLGTTPTPAAVNTTFRRPFVAFIPIN